jgi:hypothetical protein
VRMSYRLTHADHLEYSLSPQHHHHQHQYSYHQPLPHTNTCTHTHAHMQAASILLGQYSRAAKAAACSCCARPSIHWRGQPVGWLQLGAAVLCCCQRGAAAIPAPPAQSLAPSYYWRAAGGGLAQPTCCCCRGGHGWSPWGKSWPARCSCAAGCERCAYCCDAHAAAGALCSSRLACTRAAARR